MMFCSAARFGLKRSVELGNFSTRCVAKRFSSSEPQRKRKVGLYCSLHLSRKPIRVSGVSCLFFQFDPGQTIQFAETVLIGECTLRSVFGSISVKSPK